MNITRESRIPPDGRYVFYLHSTHTQACTADTRDQDIPSLGFDWWVILRSSWDGYNAGGYDATFDTSGWLDDVTDPVASAKDSISQPGVFNVVQCPLEVDPDTIPSAEMFNFLLAGPGALNDGNDSGDEPSLCHCVGIVDKNGVAFEDTLDLRSWVGQRC